MKGICAEYQLCSLLQAENAGDDSDGEYSDDGAEETQLESYNTPLDDERCLVDEYVAFKEILSSK